MAGITSTVDGNLLGLSPTAQNLGAHEQRGAGVACLLNSSETTKASMSHNVLAKTVLLLQATILGRFSSYLNHSCFESMFCCVTNLQC